MSKYQSRYDREDLFLDRYDDSVWSGNEEEPTDKEKSEDLSPILPLKS